MRMACQMILEGDFRNHILESRDPALVAFTSKACEESQQILSMMNDISGQFDGRGGIFAVDVGDDLERAAAGKLASRYRINRLPVVVAFSDGRPRDYIGGLTSKEDLAEMLERQLSPVREVIGARDFRAEVLDSKVPVLVHFHAASCDASKALIPIIEETANNFRGRAKVVRVEANPFNSAIMEEYGAIRTPVVAAFDAGVEADCIMGTIVGDRKKLANKGGSRKAVDHIAEMLSALC
jgi:thioredoxin 1